ncbi:hypothetical protein HPB51_016508 [Rhipicephalus microplus]|uniref:Tudor domain-containing protein n=1 Tax=Rhipicephalus microplus TaxID=6941 RepID=A0A9J6E1K3_RHIMP|nr:hypothetical protein HPB51_016508 [Rhipicephalus microplus]
MTSPWTSLLVTRFPSFVLSQDSCCSRHRSKKKVRVWFMDYGRWEDVSLDSLRHLPNGYERLPGFAIPVTLHGLKKIMVPKDFKFEASFFDCRGRYQ